MWLAGSSKLAQAREHQGPSRVNVYHQTKASEGTQQFAPFRVKGALQGLQRILKRAFRIKCVQRRNASVRDERAVDIEVIDVQAELPIPLLLFVDDAEEPERRAGRALERENLGRFLHFCRFAVAVKHPPLLERGVPVV